MPILIPLAVGGVPFILTDRRQCEQRSEAINGADGESIDDFAEEVEVEEACEL